MVSGNSIMVWLCWIAILGLRGIEAQGDGSSVDPNAKFGGGGGGGGRFGNGDGKGGRRFGHGPGFRKGGRFGNGRKGGQQGADQDATNDPNDEGEDEETDITSALPASTPDSAPVVTSAAPASVTAATTALPEAITSLIAESSAPSETFEQPTSVADAFPEPQSTPATLVGIPYVAPTNTAIVQGPSSQAIPAPASSPTPLSSLTTKRLTVTSSTTVFVTSTPLPPPNPVPAEEDSSAPTQATQAPSQDLAPLPASSVKPLSAGEKAGIGIGITFAVLLIAAAIAYALYRRRKTKARERLDSETASQDAASTRRSFALAGFFGPKDKREQKRDPEWSIESAEKVSIVRAGSVKSVESQPRPITPPLPNPLPPAPRSGLAGGGTEVVKVGMTVPERKPTPKMADMALRSNPPVSPSSFPSPPRAGKTGSWPLAD